MDKNDAGGLSLPHIKGPSCTRPMPLQLPSDGEIVGSPGSVGVPSASGVTFELNVRLDLSGKATTKSLRALCT